MRVISMILTMTTIMIPNTILTAWRAIGVSFSCCNRTNSQEDDVVLACKINSTYN